MQKRNAGVEDRQHDMGKPDPTRVEPKAEPSLALSLMLSAPSTAERCVGVIDRLGIVARQRVAPGRSIKRSE